MKTTLALLVFLLSTVVSAEICSVVIRDQYGYDYDSFTRSSYSINAACDDATWDCRQKLSEYQSYGRYYNATCVVREVSPSYPPSYPPTYPPYPPRYPDPREPSYPRYPRYPDPREPGYPRYPRDPREPSYPRYPRDPREPTYPREPRDPREPPRHEPGSEPRRPGPGPGRPGPHR